MRQYLPALLLAALLCLGPGSLSTAAEGEKAPAVPKWEYKVLTLEHLDALVEKAREGKKLKEKLQKEKATDQDRFPRLVEFALNQLGEDGWELVSVKLVGGAGEAILFLKRRK